MSELPTSYPKNICAYCGSTFGLNNDHIPPKNLFKKPYSQLITVKACKACHSRTSKDDEYFLPKICLLVDGNSHPDARAAMGSVFRSLNRTEAPGLREQFFADLKYLNLMTPPVILVNVLGFNVDIVRIRLVVERVIRGLYFAETKKPLGLTIKVQVYTPADYEVQPSDVRTQLKNIISPLTAMQPKIIGNNVFLYRHYVVPEDPIVSVWGISFYQQVPFFVTTGKTTLPTTTS